VLFDVGRIPYGHVVTGEGNHLGTQAGVEIIEGDEFWCHRFLMSQAKVMVSAMVEMRISNTEYRISNTEVKYQF